MFATLNDRLTDSEQKQVAQSRAAFSKMFKALPNKRHPKLVNRVRAATEQLFEVKVMTIDKFRYLYDKIEPVSIQRDHLRRIENGECNYLSELHLTHVQFVLAVDPVTHKIGLGDGNSRSTLYFVDDSVEIIPGHVVVLVYYPVNKPMYDDVYHCIDSAVNHKRTRHTFSSMYRDNGIAVDTLSPGMVADGHLVSAFRRLAKVRGKPGGITGIKGRETLKELVGIFKDDLLWLDSYKLTAKELNQGFVGALLWLRNQNLGVNDKLNLYLDEIRHLSNGDTRIGKSATVLKLWDAVTSRGLGTEKSVDYVFGKCYLMFPEYLNEISKKSSAAERKHVQQAIRKMSELPSILERKAA